MHRLKVSLLCLLSLSLAGSVFAQPAEDTQSESAGVVTYDSYSAGATLGAGSYFNIRYMSGNGVGYQGGYTHIGGMVPFWMGDNALLAPDVRLLLTNNSGVGGNLGLVGRWYSEDYDRIFGAAGYLDMDQSAYDNTYTQGTFGLETLGQFWDLRGNAYFVPGNQDHFLSNGAPLCVSGDPFFAGNRIVFTGQQAVMREQAMDGFDIEFGMPLFQSMPWLRAYAGTYYYKADQVTMAAMDAPIPNKTEDKPWGFRAHLDAWIADDLLVGVNVTTDAVWGTNVNGMVDFRFSGFKPTRYFPNFTTRERMLSPWQRNWRIAVEQYGTAREALVAAINPTTGQPYFIQFVDNSNPNPGNGTFENPFNSFNHPNGLPNADIIYVARGDSTAANPYLGTMKLFDDQRLLGEGGTVAPLPLTASFGACSVDGNFNLPGMDGSGNYPWVRNPSGNAITLADNNEVSGFHIINSAGDGIFGTGVVDANLHNLDITGNGGRGIDLVNASGTILFENVNSSGNGGGIFLSETNRNLVADFTNVTVNNNANIGIDVNGSGGSVTLNATGSGAEALRANGNGGNNLDIAMTNGGVFTGNFANSRFNNSTNGSGVAYSQNSGSGTLNLTSVQMNGNGLDGLNLLSTNNAIVNANVADSQLNANDRDGIHDVQTTGGDVNLSVSSTAINGNGRDGYFYNLAGGSGLNATFLDTTLNSNIRSGFFGTMDNSTATMALTNVSATNSGQNGFALSADNNSSFNATMQTVDLSTSGANGMSLSVTDQSDALFDLTGVTDDGNVQNGVAFLVDDSILTMQAVNSTFDNNMVNGIVGTVQNAGTANLTTSNGSSISGNTQNGVFVTTTGLSNIVADFRNTAIDNNMTGNGIQLNMDNSPASSLSLAGTTSLINNGANGLLINAANNTVFTPSLTGTVITGNSLDAIQINVDSGSTVGTGINAGTFADVIATGNGSNGLDISVTGAGSTSNLIFTNLDASANSQSNALIDVLQGGFLNLATSGANFSNSVNGSGVSANVADVNSTAYLNLDSATIDGNAAAGITGLVSAPAPGVGQTDASLNVCLDNSSVSNNTLQGISVISTGAGATASFGVGTLAAGSASNVNNNGREGVLANAIAGGTINFRSIGSHFDGNGTAVASDGLNFGGDAGVIRTLFHGGSADGNSGNGLRLGPISPNVDTFGSDLTVTLGNGFSASNNAQFGLVVDGTGANSVNVIQDPNTPPIVLNGNGAGPEDLNFAGANQVLLQLLGSFNGSAGDGVDLTFSNITTAIVSINGLGNGTIDGNAGNGIHVTMNNVQNTAVTVSGYSSISNNGLNGVLIDIIGASPANPTLAAIEVAGIPGGTAMDNNQLNGVNINLLNTNLVDPFNSLPGVNLTALTLTDNDPFNACIPMAVVLPPGQGLTPTAALRIDGLNVDNTGAGGGTGGITVAGTDATIVPNQGFITNNTVTGSQNGNGISVSLNETVAPTVPIASGFTIADNTVSGSTAAGIVFNINNAAVINVATADDLHINNNVVTGNALDGINVTLTNPTGSVSTADGMQLIGNTVTGNGANGVVLDLTTLGVAGLDLSNTTVSGNTLDGMLLSLDDVAMSDVTATNLSLTGNDANGLRLDLLNASSFTNANFVGADISTNGLDGVNVTATDGTASTFGSAGNAVRFFSSTILDNGQLAAGSDGARLHLFGGSTGNVLFNGTQIGNADPAQTQTNGVEFVLGSVAFPAGQLTAAFTNSTIDSNSGTGILGLINGTGTPAESMASVTLNSTDVTNNGAAGVAMDVDNAGTLSMVISNGSLIDSNALDGVRINATGSSAPNTTVAAFLLNSTISNNGTSGAGSGFVANFDDDSTGNITVTSSVIENTAPGGTQENGLLLNVNQNLVGSNTNVNATITDSFLRNNAISGLAGNITGNNVGLDPVNGATIVLDQTVVDASGFDGVAFQVDNGALLRMTIDNSSVTGSGQNGVFINATDAFTLVAVDMMDSSLNNNGTLLFPGDGFNGTAADGATLNICAETSIGAVTPMSFSGNTGDGLDVLVSGAGSRSDIDLHSVIAGLDAVNGLAGNLLNGVSTQVFDGGVLNLRANTTHFDGNGAAGLFGMVTDSNGLDTVGRYRIIGGTADGNIGDGFNLNATNTMGAPNGVATLTAQFEADDFGTGISAQNNGGFGLQFLTNTPGGGVVGNLLMTGGSTLLNNGAGTLNVNMQGADQAIIGLSGTFNGSTTGDGIHIELADITGLALVSLQGPGEVRNNAGDGIDVSMTNVAQGGVFIGGFTDVSDNGTANNSLLDPMLQPIGQDGIKVTMNNVALGAVTIDAQTATLPANIMNVSNNTGNGVNVIVNNGSVIDNTAFNALLGVNQVEIIDYTPPDVPCPDPLPNPLLTTSLQNVSAVLGITFQPTLTIQNLNVDNNGNAVPTVPATNLSGDGIVLTADSLAQIVGTPLITLNTVTNTGITSTTGTHDGIVFQVLGNADVTGVDIVSNDVQSNNGNGVNAIVNQAPTLTSMNISSNILSNNTGTLGVTGSGIVLDLDDAAVLATVDIDGNDVQGNAGDGFQMLNPNTGVDLTVNFLHNQFIGNGSIVPPNASTTFPAGGMGIDVVLNNQNAIQNTINILSDANGVNTISGSASFGVFVQAMNQAIYNLNVTGTGGPNVLDGNTDAGIAVVGGSFVNPNNTLDPMKFSVGNVMIDNVNITNTIAGSHPALPNYPFGGDGIGVLLQQYAQMNSFVVGSAAARNTTLSSNEGDGLRINAIEQSQFRQTMADGTTAVTPLGQATILLQQIDATGNGANGINIIRRDNALLSWDDVANAPLFDAFNPLSWESITDAGSFIHINDVIATGNTNNGLNVSTSNAQFPITRIDIIDTNPVALTYNPKTVGNSVYDSNLGRGMQFASSADSILVVNARDTSVSDNESGGILVQTFNRATFGNVLTATPLGDPTADDSVRSTFNGMLISGNGAANTNANAHGFEVQANGGTDPFNVSSQSVVNISMTGTLTNGRNLFDSNGGDAFRITASRFSDNYFNLNRIDMRDTAFVQLGSDGLHVTTTDASDTRVDLTNASIGYPTASSTQTGLSGDGIDVTTTSASFMNLNVGNSLAINRFGEGIAAGAADPINAPDVSIYGNQLNGIVIRNQSVSDFVGNVFDTASRFNGNRGYSAEMQDISLNFHTIDHSLFSNNSFEGIAVIANSRSQSGFFRDVASLATNQPAFGNTYLLQNFLNLTPTLQAQFVLTDSFVENNGGASPYVNSQQNVNGLEIDVSTRSYVAADIRNNTFSGNTLDDVATASFTATTGGFNANGTINTTGQLNTPGSIDEVQAGIDRIFLEDTAQLDMRFMHNTGDQVRISSAGSNNPNMGAGGARRTDPNTKFNPIGSQQTALFQVNAFHYDVVNTVTSDNVFTGTNIQPLDSAAGAFVQDPGNFPGSITFPGPVIGLRFLEAALVDQTDFYTNPNANPSNPMPTAFTQVRLDNITSGVNGTGANGVIGYNGATGEFTLAGAGSTGVTAGDVIRVHLLDTNTFNQFGVAQDVEAAFNNGFQSGVSVRIPQGQLGAGAGTFFITNGLAPYFQWPSFSFPPN